jgi:acetyl-CoA carboxylase biotin carboxyl carrier protein
MQIKDIHELLEKFDNSSLSELRITIENMKLVMKKGGTHLPGPAVHHSVTAESAPAPSAKTETAPAGDSAGNAEFVTAPIVGTFYRAPTPDSPPFAEPGSKFKAGETLCIIEAMKVMNEMEADYDLEVISVLVENGTMVEHGTPLFEVRRI